jgi:hypothetical protein
MPASEELTDCLLLAGGRVVYKARLRLMLLHKQFHVIARGQLTTTQKPLFKLAAPCCPVHIALGGGSNRHAH